MNSEPLISVILPVYNLGEFLVPCLDSLKTQTYPNLEFLLIDDGSTDGSGTVCDEYAKLDTRFQVIHKNNGGVSSARNTGLDTAKGSYIAFVDADDRVVPEYFDVLMEDIVTQDVQAAFCSYRLIDEDGNVLPLQSPRFTKTERISDRKDMVISATNYGIVWGGVIHKDLIGTERFLGLRYGEDSLFMYNLLCKASAISQNPFAGYLYLQRTTGATATKEIPNIFKAKDHLVVHAHRYLNLPQSVRESQTVRQKFLLHYANKFHNVAHMSVLKENRQHHKQISSFLDEHFRHLAPELCNLPRKTRFCIRLYAKAPRLYAALVRIKAALRG